MGVLLLRPAARYIGWRAHAWWHLRAERIRADGWVRTTLVPRTGEFFSLEIAIGSCRIYVCCIKVGKEGWGDNQSTSKCGARAEASILS